MSTLVEKISPKAYNANRWSECGKSLFAGNTRQQPTKAQLDGIAFEEHVQTLAEGGKPKKKSKTFDRQAEILLQEIAQSEMVVEPQWQSTIDSFCGNVKPDVFYLTTDEVLHVIDIKHGAEMVNPKNNLQLIIYAGALLEQGELRPKSVMLGIYQPKMSIPVSYTHLTLPTIYSV